MAIHSELVRNFKVIGTKSDTIHQTPFNVLFNFISRRRRRNTIVNTVGSRIFLYRITWQQDAPCTEGGIGV